MAKPPSLLSLLLILAVLAVFGVVGAKYMLGSHSDSTLRQLGTVWPGIATMPQPDRDFLVELALTCNVAAREPVRAEVVDCLRSAATGMRPAPTERLERLVREAPPSR